MATEKVSKRAADRDPIFLQECKKLKEENEQFLKTVYNITYRTEKKISGNEKTAKDLAQRVQFRMERELDLHFSQPPELLAG